MIVIAHSIHIDDERRITEPAKCHGGENRTVITVRNAIRKNSPRRAVSAFGAVRKRVEESLDLHRRAEASEDLQLDG
jgi:hypothetical protein